MSHSLRSTTKPSACLWAAAALSLGALGCGDNLEPPGAEPDAGTPEVDAMAPANSVCSAPIELLGVQAESGSATGDTASSTLSPVDLGDCVTAGDTAIAQQVVAYTVPGSGRTGVEFSLVNDGTPASFDTVVQVRSACEMTPEELATSCFDNASFAERRSRGTFFAEGGDTVYFVITGDPEPGDGRVSEGAWRLEVFSDAASTPSIDSARVTILQTFLDIAVSGGDSGADASGVRVLPYIDEDTIYDTNFDGMGDQRDRVIFPLPEVSGETSFSRGVRQEAFGNLYSGDVVAAEVSIVDRFGDESERIRVDVLEPDLRGPDASCDQDVDFCAVDLACEEQVCTVPTAVSDACDAATAIAIDTPAGDTVTTTTQALSLPAGSGVFTATCTETGSAEVLFTVEVPAGGPFDLLATTALEATGEIDTVLYARTSCVDPTTEVTCNDDADRANDVYQSTIVIEEAAAGSYTLVVEDYAFAFDPLPADIELQVSLRPVLSSGASCDDAEVENRCADGACTDGTCPEPLSR